MRTTLTLDEDVAALLRKEMARRRTNLKEVLNDAVRRGLLGAPEKKKRYRVVAFKTGPARLPLDNVAELLAVAEGEDFR